MSENKVLSFPQFMFGQLIIHNKFDYRGVIIQVDPYYKGTDEWYDQVTKSRPPKDEPWYHVLVHQQNHTTYVAERHLAEDTSLELIEHPLIEHFFTEFKDGKYHKNVH